MATPRRLAVIIDGLASSQPDVEKVVKGPIAKAAFDENNNLTKAGEGLRRKTELEQMNSILKIITFTRKFQLKVKIQKICCKKMFR